VELGCAGDGLWKTCGIARENFEDKGLRTKVGLQLENCSPTEAFMATLPRLENDLGLNRGAEIQHPNGFESSVFIVIGSCNHNRGNAIRNINIMLLYPR
jgi:hypothetical protein